MGSLFRNGDGDLLQIVNILFQNFVFLIPRPGSHLQNSAERTQFLIQHLPMFFICGADPSRSPAFFPLPKASSRRSSACCLASCTICLACSLASSRISSFKSLIFYLFRFRLLQNTFFFRNFFFLLIKACKNHTTAHPALSASFTIFLLGNDLILSALHNDHLSGFLQTSDHMILRCASSLHREAVH